MSQALIDAWSIVDADDGRVLRTATSWPHIGVSEALFDGGAALDGSDGTGSPMAFALRFGFTQIAELFASHGVTIDALRSRTGLG